MRLLAALVLCLPLLVWAAEPTPPSGNASTAKAEPKAAAPGRKIDEPIPETYQPLTGPRWSNTFSDALNDARTLRREKQGKTWPQKQPQQKPPEKFNIQAPQPATPPPPSKPQIEEQGNNLSIHEK